MISRRQLILGTSSLAALTLVNRPVYPSPDHGPADLIMTSGEIHTVDATNSRVAAMAVRQGRILATGTVSDIDAQRGPGTRVINLDGRTVLPGINDSHLHLQGWAMSRPPYALELTYPRVNSIQDVVDAVATAVANRQAFDWIIGRGWDQAYFKESRAPSRADLDAVAPRNPVVLTEFSGHAVWVNSVALKIAGINRDSIAEAGGVIVRDDAGEPTGLLFEGPAFRLRHLVPAPDALTKQHAVIDAMIALSARGITSATDPGLSPEDLDIYGDIASQSDTTRLRMTGMLQAGVSTDTLGNALNGWKNLQSPAPDWLRLSAVKIMGDGIPTSNKTAWLNEPYASGGNGSLLVAGNSHQDRITQLRAMVVMIHETGLQAGIHVTGSRSIDEAVAACAAAQAAHPRQDPRHYLIHADLVSEMTLDRMAQLGIGANFNPEIKHLIADSQVASIGPVRAAYEWPYRSALAAGVKTASSSDAPVTEGNWLQGIATCMDRRGKQSGLVSGPAQRINLDEAIRTYTIAGAWQDHAEHYKGSLEVGKAADFCVLDGRLSESSTVDMPNMQVAMTAINGRIVHDRL